MSIQTFLHKYSSILIPLFFVLMGTMSIIVLASTHIIYFNTDLTFHWYRMNELHYDIINRTLPQFDSHTTTPYGLATMIYYPYETLLPFSLLTFIIKRPVTLFYTMYALIVTLRCFISYYSYKTIDKSKTHSIIFAILYSINSILFSYMIRDGDIGVLLATLFLPIAFFGMINLLKKGRWLMLSIGLSLVIFSHVLSAAMLIALLVALTILNIHRFFNWKRLLGLISAVVLSIITTALFWGPMFQNMLMNEISQPAKFQQFYQGLFSQIGSTSNHTYSLVELLGLLTILFIRRFKWFDLQLWLIGTFCLLINISFVSNLISLIFPMISIFQFSYRFSILAHIIFSFLLTKWIVGVFHNYKINYLMLFILVPILLFMQVGNQMNYKFLLGSRHLIDTPNFQLPANPKGPYDLQHNYNNQSFDYVKHSNYNIDYAPRAVEPNVSIFGNLNTIMLDNHHKFIKFGHFTPTSEGIKVNINKKVSRLVLPITVYKGYDYEFGSNGLKILDQNIDKDYTNKTALLTLKDVQPGNYVFQLYPKVNHIIQLSYYATMIGLLINIILMVVKLVRYLLKKKKNRVIYPISFHP